MEANLTDGAAPHNQELLPLDPLSANVDVIEGAGCLVVLATSSDQGYEPGATLALQTGGSQEPTAQRMLVLVAHDDPMQRKLLKLLIERLGYEVEVAVDGYDAFDMAQCFLPDAIVSDVLMPRLDGFGLCELVRSDPRIAHIPVILVSVARTEANDRRLAQSVGATDLVPAKPDFTEVVQALLANLGQELPKADGNIGD